MQAIATRVRARLRRARPEGKLDAGEIRFRTLTENSSDIITIVDADGRVRYASPSARTLGYEPGELFGHQGFGYVHPDDRVRVRRAFEGAMRGESLGSAEEFRFRHKDGSWRTLLAVTTSLLHISPAGGAIVSMRDVTEHENARAQVRTRERQFKAIVDAVNDIVLELDGDGRYLNIWASDESKLARPRAELLGKRIDEVLRPDEAGRLAEPLRRVLHTGVPETLEYPLSLADGTHWFLGRLTRLAGIDRGPDTVCMGITDITDRKRADQALARSEAHFRTLTENASDMITVVDREGRVIYESASVARQQGRPAQDVLGRPVFERVHPDDVAEVRRALHGLIQGSGPQARLRFRFQYRDGTWHVLESVGRNLLDDPAVRGIVLNTRDVTDQARAAEALQTSETKFRALTENSTDLIASLDLDGRLTYASPSAHRILGYEPGALLGESAFDYIHPEDVARVREAFVQAVASHDTTALRAQFRFRHLDGSWRAFEAVASNMLDVTAVRGVVLNCRDITEQRALEAQFRQAQRLEAVGRLAGGVAHDFNNILTAITAYSELLLGELPPDDQKRGDVEEIRAAAQRAAALTRQLLAFSRKQVLQVKVLDLNAVVRTLDRMLQRLLGEDVRLELALSDGLGAVRADPVQMEQVIMNLAVNARDAMPAGGRLTIETANVVLDDSYSRMHQGAKPGRYVMLAMSDTGIGMDEETRSHLFEPFFTTKGQGKGTGLGLATVYGIVKQSGGNIWVYSEPGRGATFRLYLPRVDEQPEPLVRRATLPVAGGNETVLLAEDDAAVREVMAQALEHKGYRVLRASDGHMALDLARAHSAQIDLLVTDLVMPGMTGRELALGVLAVRRDVRVIYMSGYSDEAVVRHGVLEKGLHYLQKPFAIEDLARKVREVLDAPSSNSSAGV